MIGWNLPPGCTQRDIDEAFGDDSVCEVCGHAFPDGQLGWVRVRSCAKVWACEGCTPDPDRLREEAQERERIDEENGYDADD